MIQRFKNFFLYGIFSTDEHLGLRNPFEEKTKKVEKELKDKEPVKMEKEDRKAFMIAALQVFGPFFAVLLVIAFILLFITAKFF